MKTIRTPRWSRLDNAAKIFPSNSSKADSKVFRFFCELKEQVEPDLLQSALDRTMEQFPFYQAVMKQGLFWYYFEDSDLKARVSQESRPPCLPLYDSERRSLLFRVLYFGRRINLEIYHALTDGTGALQFLCTLVYYYLLQRHGEDFAGSMPELNYDASQSQKWDDSFQKYYEKPEEKPSVSRIPWKRKAYHLRGERMPEKRIAVVEGRMSLQALLACSRERGVTLTEFLTAVLICSIHEGMRLREQSRPVVITVPVNLRGYFPSESVRNFFATINVAYDFSRQEDSLEAVSAYVRQSFRENLTQENLRQRMNTLCALEHNIPMRIVPLPVKDPVLRGANYVSNRQVTASFSNVGRVTMPAEMQRYIHLFGVFSSPNKLQASACSFLDHYVVSFAGPYCSHDVERVFFRTMTQLGLDVVITTNVSYGEAEV